MKQLIAASLLFLTLPLFAAHAPEPTPVGDWVTYKNDDGETKESIVQIYEAKDKHGNLVYNGKVSRSFRKPSDTTPKICVDCPAPFTGKKILGMEFLWGFVPDDEDSNKFVDGHVLDPLSGTLYNGEMTLSDDGKTLVLRGFAGISLFGSDRTWTRANATDESTSHQ